MNILITEEQFDTIKKEEFKKILFKYWDIQKKKGKSPELDEIVYDITGVKKNSSKDYDLVRPIWYEYNGGYEKLFSELREETKGKRFNIKGNHNLDIVVNVDYVTAYDISNSGGMVDLICSVYKGTVDYEFYDADSNEPEIEQNVDIFDVYHDLEYDTEEFTRFINDSIGYYFNKKFDYFGIPLYVETTW
jgi:hypothetical protein